MNNEQAICNIKSCIALLAQHKKVHSLSLFLTLGAIASILLFISKGAFSAITFWPLLIIFLLGIFELMLTIHIAYDQALLKALVNDLNQKKDTLTEQLALLDNALSQLKLIPLNMQTKISRTLNERLLGCIGLFKKQIALCFSQIVILISFLVVVYNG